MRGLSPPSASPVTARRPATGSVSATRTCGSASRTDRQAAGDEPIWGYAKTLRPRSTQGRPSDSELDAVIAGALVLDPVLGVIKADIGIKDGRIVGVGRAGNAAISDGIELRIGPHTRPIMGYGLIATPGAVDSHVHLDLAGTPARRPCPAASRRSSRPASRNRHGAWPGRSPASPTGRSTSGCRPAPGPRTTRSLDALLDAGACGFKIHEDYGAYPELIDHALRYADAHDVTVSLHTDGLHESAELEDTVAAIAGRTVHAYHVEGSGGGHVPDVIGLVREANIICSSTTPTVPWGVNAAAEQRADDRPQPRRVVRGRRGRRARPRAHPPGHDGRRGAAARARRDRHRQLRLAGDGPDHGDGPAHVPARPRHEVRWRGDRARLADGRRRASACCATSPRSRSSRRSPTASPTTSARCRPAASPTSSCGSRRSSA